jgi:hypothetical protein
MSTIAAEARLSCKNSTTSRFNLKQSAVIHSSWNSDGAYRLRTPDVEAGMMTAHQDVHAGWTRLESLLTEMKPGDSVSIDALAAETGLTPAILLTVLKELQRVELFTRQDEKVFVRRSLWQQTG